MTTFGFTLEYPVPPQQVREMLIDPEYVNLRCDAFDVEPTSVETTSDAHATTITTVVSAPQRMLTPIVRAFVGNRLRATIVESWRPMGNTPCQGVTHISTSALSLTINATQILEPFGGKTKRIVEGTISAQYDVTGSIERRISQYIDKARRIEHHIGVQYREKHF